jgi:hypothetical protein
LSSIFAIVEQRRRGMDPRNPGPTSRQLPEY